MSIQQQRLRLGIFVFISLLLLASIVIMFGGASHWFAKRNQYTMLFSDAPGITPGTAVRKSGVKVGEVSSIDLDDESGQVRVVVNLDAKFTPRTSDEPTVTRGLIVGDTAIDFIPKSGDKRILGEAYPAGSTIQGVSPFNAKVLIDQATGVVPEAQKSLEQVRRSLEALQKIAPQFETTLREFALLARSSREFVPELKRTIDGFRDLFANTDLSALKDVVPDLKKTMADTRSFLQSAQTSVNEVSDLLKKNEPRLARALDSFANTSERVSELLTPENQKSMTAILGNIRDASARLDRLGSMSEGLLKDGKIAMKSFSNTMTQAEQALAEIREVTKPLASKASKIVDNLDSASDQVGKTMVEIRELVKAVGRSEGTFQKFIADPSLYNNINDSTATLTKMLPRLEGMMKDLEVFADKIARHPEILGVGGALRPSSGLKTIPSTTGIKSQPH